MSFAQNSETIYPNFIGHTLNSIHNNSDWKILVKVEGDLDGDNLNDCVIVLESKDSIIEKRCNDCKSFQQKPRILLVLTFDDDKLQVIIQNNQFIARGNEGGMSPYIEPELTIDNGLLKIFYQ